MEGEGVISVESHPPVAEIMPQESPEDLGFQETELLSTAIPSSSDETIVLTDDLRDKIIRQVEYYFSDENLPTDKFLMKYVKRDKEGFVPVAVIASFRKMKKLVQDNSMIVTALRESTLLVLSSDGKRVKRIHPLTVTEVKDAKSRTVLVENLLDDYSMENIQRIFGDVGNIKNISICDPHAMDESTKSSKAEKVISSKIHALVEYETVEAAEKAVATLNDEKNWRSGMRVELLLKRMGKYGLAKKGWKSTASEKNNDPVSVSAGDGQPLKSMSHHDETPEQVEEEHSLNERNGQKGRSRGRSRGYKQRNFNGQGHGALYSGPGIEGSKPPPGPRMPDGTRGFTMGRGRSPVSDQN